MKVASEKFAALMPLLSLGIWGVFAFMVLVLFLRVAIISDFLGGEWSWFVVANCVSWLMYAGALLVCGVVYFIRSPDRFLWLAILFSVLGALFSMSGSGDRLFLRLSPGEFYAFPAITLVASGLIVVRRRFSSPSGR